MGAPVLPALLPRGVLLLGGWVWTTPDAHRTLPTKHHVFWKVMSLIKGTEVGKVSNRKQWRSRKHLLHLLTFPWNLPFWGSNTPDWMCPALLQAHLSEAPCRPPCRHLLGVLISSRGISSLGPLPLSRISPGCPPCHSESLYSFHSWGLVCPSLLCSSGDLWPLVFVLCGKCEAKQLSAPPGNTSKQPWVACCPQGPVV